MHLELCRELTLDLVSFEHILAVVGGTTDGAFKGPIPKVATLVVTHIPLCLEALTTALWTWVRPLVFVDIDVNLEVLLLTEDFTTAREWTLERLCPIMDVHVGLKSCLTCKCLIAAWMLTDKKLRRPYNIERTTRAFVFCFFICLHRRAFIVD